MTADARKPHKAVVMFVVEVHELSENGECSGTPVSASELGERGIATKQVLQLNGQNKDDCLKKLKRIIDEFK